MSTMRVDNILSSGGTNTATINGITPAIATQPEAVAGTDNTKLMTALRTREALRREEFSPVSLIGSGLTVSTFPNDYDEVTIFLEGVSLTSTGNIELQLGAGGVLQTTGYDSQSTNFSGNYGSAITNAIGLVHGSAALAIDYALTFIRLPGANRWQMRGQGKYRTNASVVLAWGDVTLSGPLNVFRIQPTASNTFDSGNVSFVGRRT